MNSVLKLSIVARLIVALLWLIVVGGCHEDNPQCDEGGSCILVGGDVTVADGDSVGSGDGVIIIGSDAEGDSSTEVADCDDGNPCTDDSVGEGGACANTSNHLLCDDGNLCTAGESCNSENQCTGGSPVLVDDGNPCTTDSCNPDTGVDLHTAATGGCDDGDECTAADACTDTGACAGAPIVCNDGNPCTGDSCEKENGCVYDAVECDDGNPCTNDSCNQLTGACGVMNTALPCDDGNECTESDKCANGSCGAGTTVTCNDANVCTLDQCAPATGCIFGPIPGPCDDGSPLTESDSCSNGVCSGSLISCSDDDNCTIDTKEANDQCTHTPLGCDDGNVCTTDACDPASGCVFAPATGACDDGNACTIGDMCKDGKCVVGLDALCDDANPCTNDGCKAVSGCYNTSIISPACEPGKESCGNGKDDDLDGDIDASDVECAGQTTATTGFYLMEGGLIHAQSGDGDEQVDDLPYPYTLPLSIDGGDMYAYAWVYATNVSIVSGGREFWVWVPPASKPYPDLPTVVGSQIIPAGGKFEVTFPDPNWVIVHFEGASNMSTP